MLFKHPEILWALFLFIIPILIHLFQLRRFQKEAFTNVAFLKKVNLQTRKSAKLKKWLVLITRLLAITALVLAFVQPYFSNRDVVTTSEEKVIYLDNSFSMQLKGPKGELLPSAVTQLIENIPEKETFSLFTNTETFKDVTINDIKNELLALPYSASQLSLDEITLKGKQFFNTENSIKNLLIISDFQQRESLQDSLNDIKLNWVQLKPSVTDNISVDSIYIVEKDLDNYQCGVMLSSNFNTENTGISLYNGKQLIAKTAANFKDGKAIANFTIPAENKEIQGTVTIEDNALQYDNKLYFTINKQAKIRVLAINEADDTFLKRIFTEDEFEYSSVNVSNLDFNIIPQQNLIILNELKVLSSTLGTALTSAMQNGMKMVVIPSEKSSLPTYNNFFSSIGSLQLKENIQKDNQITTIAFDHPLFKNVFEERVTNFQYPKTTLRYSISGNFGSPISFSDGSPFLAENNGLYVFTSPLNTNITNFQNAPLIVPTFYNIGKESLSIPTLNFTIENDNIFDVPATLNSDEILTISNSENSFIPLQQTFNNRVRITAKNQPNNAGVYTVAKENDSLLKVAFNHSRKESELAYLNISQLETENTTFSIEETFKNIKSENNVDELWKWFVIFALILLCIELLILKYFK
ncbi:BatA domain-containing protein [Galbibacter mesophilus]|uniref:BatA domain-containing protein n=1 Tax=Galbibacter mesophilus TaxID=379069 RepID=UPI00191FC121|nr:BatA domain-containing protein [Galbibacter mesophilus]MCM5662968.1 BatA domain-containing protein [Galbibacter mesophilus]